MKVSERFSLLTRYTVYKLLYRFRRNIAVSHDEPFFDLYRDVTQSRRLTMNLPELYNLYRLVPRVENITGDIAELGVFRGASARILCAVKGEKTLHLFDTFSGLPDIDGADVTAAQTAFSSAGRENLAMKQGKFSASYEDVRAYLDPFPHVELHPGVFPETADAVKDRTFSFVHLDADIYSSTLAGLEFFYPRLAKGGMLVSHDYATVSCPGVKRAFTEFMSDKVEPLIELWDTQVLFVKT